MFLVQCSSRRDFYEPYRCGGYFFFSGDAFGNFFCVNFLCVSRRRCALVVPVVVAVVVVVAVFVVVDRLEICTHYRHEAVGVEVRVAGQ